MKSLSKQIEEWVGRNKNWFTYHQLDRAFSLTTQKEKTLRRVVIYNLAQKGLVMKSPNHDGLYKYLEPLKSVDLW